MKRQITSWLAIILSGLLLLVSMPASAQSAPQRFRSDSGFVTLTTPQILRITVNGGAGNDTIRVRLRWMQYGTQSCSGMPSVCRHMVVSQGVTSMETLGPDDSLSFDLPGMGDGVRVVVESSSRDTRVLGIVFDTSTKRINAICTFIPD